MPDMGAGCGMGAEHGDHHHAGTLNDPDDPTAKCGYCSLLAHTPAVDFGISATLAPVYLPTLSPAARLSRNEPIAQLLSARPRGPPRLG
jgi:hypothetical protein